MVRIFLLFLAILAGGAAAWLSFVMRAPPSATNEDPQSRAQKPVAVVDILIASRDVPRGQVITPDHMRWAPWPEAAVNQKFITRAAQPDAIRQIAGSVVSERVVELEPIYQDKIGPRGAGALASLLPAGKRAIAVRINAENTAGGFILPNDHVDVLHSTQAPAGAGGERRTITRTILRNVMVLAIDQVMHADAETEAKAKPAVIGKTATLELTSAQAEAIIAAEATGALSLVLRSVKDIDETEKAVETSSQTIRVFRGREAETVRIPSSPSKDANVE